MHTYFFWEKRIESSKTNEKKCLKHKKTLTGIIALFFAFWLTACTEKEDVLLELEKQEATQIQDVAQQDGNVVAENNAEENESPQAQAEESAIAQTMGTDTSEAGAVLVTVPETKIYVHICGAVKNPGVYELNADSRVYEGIEAAGGFTEEASRDYVNQAEPLYDGQRLVIPTEEEIEKAKAEGTFQELWASEGADVQGAGQSSGQNQTVVEHTDGLVNINTATQSELCTINGIGESRAEAIVKYRQENGNFTSVEDIMKVSGIKEGTYEKIKDKITVN